MKNKMQASLTAINGFAVARILFGLLLLFASAVPVVHGASPWNRTTHGTQNTFSPINTVTTDTSVSYSFDDNFGFVCSLAATSAELTTYATNVWVQGSVYSQNNGGDVGFYKDDLAASYSGFTWTGTPGAALPVTNHFLVDITGQERCWSYARALYSGQSASGSGQQTFSAKSFGAGQSHNDAYSQLTYVDQYAGGAPNMSGDVDFGTTPFDLTVQTDYTYDGRGAGAASIAEVKADFSFSLDTEYVSASALSAFSANAYMEFMMIPEASATTSGSGTNAGAGYTLIEVDGYVKTLVYF